MTRWDEDILHSCDDLRKLIIENSDLPLITFVGEEAYTGEYYWACAHYVQAEIGEVLYDRGPFDEALDEEQIYIDREYVEEKIAEYLFDNRTFEQTNWTDERWEEYVERIIRKYDPLWQKCIILHVDN